MDFDSVLPRFLREGVRVRRPGMPVLPPGVERYEIAPQSARAFALLGGDKLRIVDVEGGQAAEITAFRPDGRSDVGLLDVRFLSAAKNSSTTAVNDSSTANSPSADNAPTLTAAAKSSSAAAKSSSAIAGGKAENLKQILGRVENERFAAMFAKNNLSLDNAASLVCFGAESCAGEEAELTAADDSLVIIAAGGEDMRADGQNPPTSLLVWIERAAKTADNAAPILPEPLADAAADFRIARATAAAYEVKKGEWIQIIDVAGRQCTDFQAFSAAALARGKERCLDATASRTLMRRAYPAPGLQAKYYDYNFSPLVEIVQDTCGRHDAFGLACSAKYYEDAGYPGHVNCSDNFNSALSPYGVEARRGWMAMNFFFNTAVAECGALTSDEPWSRPGDYVLLRALEDLVCVSSACPDDIDPANGWNPTDIHIRTYPKSLHARRSILFRKRADSEGEMTKETGFHSRTSAQTRDFAEYNGYWLPNGFASSGAADEYWACREKAAAIDLSALRKFEICGEDAEALLQHCLTRDVRRLADGGVVYSAMCYDNGGMIDDGTLFRLGSCNFRWVGGCDYGGEWLRQKAAELKLDARVKTSTDQLHNLSVQGPNSRDILADIVWTVPQQPELREIKWFRFAIGRLQSEDGAPIIVSRTGYTGELGYEIFCHPKDAPAVWDAVMEAGESRGILPMGLAALDILRVEAGLIFANHEFDDQTDPFEAGIGFVVAKTKTEDFIGRAALQQRRENPQRVLVGLELAGEEIAAHGDGVYVGRQQVGVITSAVLSPVLQKNIALCRMSAQHSDIGAQVEVGKLDGRQKRIPATVVPFPFYDPEKKKPRS